MDKIAAVVGFNDPIFGPTLRGFAGSGSLSFAIVEQVRGEPCPIASFQSTLIACAAPAPAMSVEAAMGHEKVEAEKAYPPQMTFLPDDRPEAGLRIRDANGNDAARRLRLRFDRNLEAPEASVFARLSSGEVDRGSSTDLSGCVSLSLWQHADGSTLGDMTVFVEARRVSNVVLGPAVLDFKHPPARRTADPLDRPG
jgi:hypothetical protein